MTEPKANAEQATPARPGGGSSFAGNVFKLLSGTTSAQALSILVAPILSRLYAPDAFGTAAVFASATIIIGVVACLRYELAIMLPEEDTESANVLALSVFFVLITAGLSAVCVWIAGTPIVRMLNAPDLQPYLWLVPVAVLAYGVSLSFSYWNARAKRFGWLSLATVSQSTAINAAELGNGVFGQADAGGLIVSRVFGTSMVMVGLAGQTCRVDGHRLRQGIHWRGMVAAARRYHKFPLYGTWSALLNSLSRQLPTFLLSMFFSSTVVGWYALGTRVLQLPMSLIGDSIARVFFQRAAEAKAQGTLSTVVEGVFRRLVAVGLFPLLLLTFIGRDLFVIVFGESWAEAGVYAQILSIWSFVWLISAPLSSLYSILEKQEFGLALEIVFIVTRVLSLVIGGLLGNARLAFLLFAVSGVLVYGYLSLKIITVSGVPWRRVGSILVSNVALFVPAGATLVTLAALGVPPLAQIGASCGILGIYYLYVLKTDPVLRGLLSQVGLLRRLAGWIGWSEISRVGREHRS